MYYPPIIPHIGRPVEMPAFDEEALKEDGTVLHKAKEASTLTSDLVLVTGEVARVTDFERGFPWAEAKIDRTRLRNRRSTTAARSIQLSK